MAYTGLTYEQFITLAKEWYKWGGDSFVECWGQQEFDAYVELLGPITKTRAKKMFRDEYYTRKEYEATAW